MEEGSIETPRDASANKLLWLCFYEHCCCRGGDEFAHQEIVNEAGLKTA